MRRRWKGNGEWLWNLYNRDSSFIGLNLEKWLPGTGIADQINGHVHWTTPKLSSTWNLEITVGSMVWFVWNCLCWLHSTRTWSGIDELHHWYLLRLKHPASTAADCLCKHICFGVACISVMSTSRWGFYVFSDQLCTELDLTHFLSRQPVSDWPWLWMAGHSLWWCATLDMQVWGILLLKNIKKINQTQKQRSAYCACRYSLAMGHGLWAMAIQNLIRVYIGTVFQEHWNRNTDIDWNCDLESEWEHC